MISTYVVYLKSNLEQCVIAMSTLDKCKKIECLRFEDLAANDLAALIDIKNSTVLFLFAPPEISLKQLDSCTNCAGIFILSPSHYRSYGESRVVEVANEDLEKSLEMLPEYPVSLSKLKIIHQQDIYEIAQFPTENTAQILIENALVRMFGKEVYLAVSTIDAESLMYGLSIYGESLSDLVENLIRKYDGAFKLDEIRISGRAIMDYKRLLARARISMYRIDITASVTCSDTELMAANDKKVAIDTHVTQLEGFCLQSCDLFEDIGAVIVETLEIVARYKFAAIYYYVPPAHSGVYCVDLISFDNSAERIITENKFEVVNKRLANTGEKRPNVFRCKVPVRAFKKLIPF